MKKASPKRTRSLSVLSRLRSSYVLCFFAFLKLETFWVPIASSKQLCISQVRTYISYRIFQKNGIYFLFFMCSRLHLLEDIKMFHIFIFLRVVSWWLQAISVFPPNISSLGNSKWHTVYLETNTAMISFELLSQSEEYFRKDTKSVHVFSLSYGRYRKKVL